MLIFGMGLYGLFISNVPPDVSPKVDRALKNSSLFGMFAMKVTFMNLKSNCFLYPPQLCSVSICIDIPPLVQEIIIYWFTR